MRSAKQILQSIVADVEAMQVSGQYWFGPFTDSTDEGRVYWPNLGILMEEARQALSADQTEKIVREIQSEDEFVPWVSDQEHELNVTRMQRNVAISERDEARAECERLRGVLQEIRRDLDGLGKGLEKLRE